MSSLLVLIAASASLLGLLTLIWLVIRKARRGTYVQACRRWLRAEYLFPNLS